VPTPVGPLGPDEYDPNDPDLWDWSAEEESPRRRSRYLRVIAWLIAAVFALVVVINVVR
jgi:hypothetical protein